MVHVHEVVAAAFIEAARPLAAALDARWPTELEEATLRHLRAHGLPALSLLEG